MLHEEKEKTTCKKKEKLCTGKLRNPHEYVDRNTVKIKWVVILNLCTGMNISSLENFNENTIYYLIF
jgi:hypothetical protein